MRVIAAGTSEVIALGFAPVSCELLVCTRRISLTTLGPAGAEAPVKIAHAKPTRFDFTPDGRAVIFPRRTGGPLRLDLTTRAGAFVRLNARQRTIRCGLSADGTRLVTSHGDPSFGSHSGWHLTDGKWDRAWSTPTGSIDPAPLAVCPTGERLACVARVSESRGLSRVFEVKTRSAATGKDEAAGDYPFRFFDRDRLWFRPDGCQLLTVSETTLLAWPVPELGAPRIVRNTSRKHFTAAAYHPNNRHLFTTSNDAAVTVWDTQTWEPVKQFTWDIGRLKAVALSADGALAAVGSATGQIVVWDVDL
jgi:WD40 repeat protein